MEIRHAAKFAIHNRNQLERVNICGCYYCFKIFEPKEIKEWVDEDDTAMCPYCEIDSVLPEAPDCIITEDLLKKINKYYF
jgi:hypothetical protein